MKKLIAITVMLAFLLPAAHVAMAGKRGSRKDAQDNAAAASVPAAASNAATPTRTGLRLPSIFGDHMILQQKMTNTIWGWAMPGEKVTVESSWGASASTQTNADGRWKVLLDTPSYGTGFSLKIIGSKTIEIKDVAIGEVWLCAGQSNMGWSVGSFGTATTGLRLAFSKYICRPPLTETLVTPKF